MNDAPISTTQTSDATLARQIGAQAARKLAARRSPTQAWLGLGMMGLIGWSVVIPTLGCAALGHWLDTRQGGHSWTLALLVAGLMMGCANAWHWVSKEQTAMHEDDEPKDE